jgi:hypothetical protein
VNKKPYRGKAEGNRQKTKADCGGVESGKSKNSKRKAEAESGQCIIPNYPMTNDY